MKKILLIGADGMLGQYISDVLKEDNSNYEVFPTTKNDLDITDKSALQARVEQVKPDIIINTAAFNDVDACEENLESFDLAMKVNGEAPGYMAKIAKENDILLVHYSSDYVFDGVNDDGYNEYMQAFPINKYGESKLHGDKMVQEKGDKYFIIRTSRLFGDAGESEDSKKTFVKTMIGLAKTKDSLDLVNEESSCPTYAFDLAIETKKLIESDKKSGIYHIMNDGACTWYEFAKEIFKLKNIQINTNPVDATKFPRPAVRPDFSILVSTKWPKLRTWQDALADYIKTL